MTKVSKIAAVLPTKTSAADEKGLAKCFDAMLDAQKDIDALLTAVGKTNPMPATIDADLKKRLTIAKSRAAEIKDMVKDRAKGTLHSNPSKMARVYKDLNEDVAQANWLEGGVEKALTEHYDKDIAVQVVKLAKGLPAGVTPGHIAFSTMIKNFREKNVKEGWAKYAANLVALENRIAADAAEVLREISIKALAQDAAFANLRYGVRAKIIEAGVAAAAATVATITPILTAALDKQRKPAKGGWANYLDLGAGGGYSLKSGGVFQGHKIHLTMSKDSWTAEADGVVNVATNSVQQIYEKLLKVADWKQLHATLEVPGPAKDYPHVFLFDGVLGSDTKWEAARVSLGRDAKWVADGVAALTAELVKVQNGLKAKITEAKKQDGANVV